MYPSQVVAVVPSGVEKDALALPSFKLPSPKGDELVSAFVKTPGWALRDSGFQLSRSIRSATVKVFGAEDGGASIEAILDDENAQAAQKNAKRIQRDIDAITLASNWLLSGSRFAEPVQASVNGNKIRLVLLITRAQAERILSLAAGALTPEGRRTVKSTLRSLIADAGASAPKPAVDAASSAGDGTPPPASGHSPSPPAGASSTP
jgi:hypothetical protein